MYVDRFAESARFAGDDGRNMGELQEKKQEHRVHITAFISLPTLEKKIKLFLRFNTFCCAVLHTFTERDTVVIELVTSWLQVCPTISRKNNNKLTTTIFDDF